MAVIDYHEGFDIKEYTDTFADKTKDWLIVWEIGKGKKHWHAVFTVKKFPQGHAPSFQQAHPLKSGDGRRATKPIRISKNPQDPMKWFQYCCKTWMKTEGDCLVDGSFTNDELQEMGEASDAYVKSFNEDIEEKCNALPLVDCATTMHSSFVAVHLDAYDAHSKLYHPSIKMRALTLLGRHDDRYRPYVIKKFTV